MGLSSVPDRVLKIGTGTCFVVSNHTTGDTQVQVYTRWRLVMTFQTFFFTVLACLELYFEFKLLSGDFGVLFFSVSGPNLFYQYRARTKFIWFIPKHVLIRILTLRNREQEFLAHFDIGIRRDEDADVVAGRVCCQAYRRKEGNGRGS